MEKVRAQLHDAVSKGATVSYTGHQADAMTGKGPNFYPPTVLTGATPDMLFTQEETFGPLAFLVPFQTDDEVITMANKSNAGLASYIYTEIISRVWRVSEALKCGMVGVRVGLISACEQPFGGIKDSGIGREVPLMRWMNILMSRAPLSGFKLYVIAYYCLCLRYLFGRRRRKGQG